MFQPFLGDVKGNLKGAHFSASAFLDIVDYFPGNFSLSAR